MAQKKKTKQKPAKSSIRDSIDVPGLISALEQHILGKKEMTATQVNAALALLKKILPDMTASARRAPQEKKAPKTSKAHEDALRELE